MYCANCGKQINDDATYCVWCGAPVEPDATGFLQREPAQRRPVQKRSMETGSISSDHKVLTNQCREYGEGLAKGLLNYLRERENDEQKQHTKNSGN